MIAATETGATDQVVGKPSSYDGVQQDQPPATPCTKSTDPRALSIMDRLARRTCPGQPSVVALGIGERDGRNRDRRLGPLVVERSSRGC